MKYNNYTDSQGIIGVPAVAWCRNQIIDGFQCDLPNLYQAICIFACGDKLDELDATISYYSNMRLGYSTTYGNRTNHRWTSTNYSSNIVRYMGLIGDCGSEYKFSTHIAIPILEF